MDPRVEESTIHNSPHAFINKRGEAILIRTLPERLGQRLIDMYLAFQPRNSFNGLPPIRDDVCVNWVKHMIDTGLNLVALSFEEGVVGHIALFPITDVKCEMLVAVSPSFQETGIGTELSRCAAQLGYETGFEKIWLSVETTNVRARHVYKKCGFEYHSREEAGEVEMALDLKRYHDAVKVSIAEIITRDVITIREEDTCRTALEIFLNNHVATLPVVDESNTLVGLISETDLMLPTNVDKKVSDIETREVLALREDYSIAQVVRMFQSRRVRCFPVVNGDNKLVGVVGKKDVLAYYHKHF